MKKDVKGAIKLFGIFFSASVLFTWNFTVYGHFMNIH